MNADERAIRALVGLWHSAVRVIPLAGGDPAVRAGNALSILRKQPEGSWVLVRDANMLAEAS
jgi:hypothetical protein